MARASDRRQDGPDAELTGWVWDADPRVAPAAPAVRPLGPVALTVLGLGGLAAVALVFGFLAFVAALDRN